MGIIISYRLQMRVLLETTTYIHFHYIKLLEMRGLLELRGLFLYEKIRYLLYFIFRAQDYGDL